MPTSIFVVGATGYQGSTLVHELLEQKGDYDITILSRSEASAAPYKEKGCNVLIGDFEATEVLQRGARGADVVFSLASADDLSPVRTLVEALKPKGKDAIFIHTSGTSVLGDDSKSQFASDTVYSDADFATIAALPPTQMHKTVDDWILANARDIFAVIVCPPTIYGEAGNPARQSVQVPALAAAMFKAGKAACVGPGKAVWNYVHVKDLASCYVTILKAALAARGDERATLEGFYFCEAGGPFAWGDLCKAVVEALVAENALKAAAPLGMFDEKEHQELLFGDATWGVLGCNARCKAERARALGWSPTQPGLFECVPGDTRRAVQKLRSG